MSRYACSDFHGQYFLYEEINKIIKPEDTVYFLGDATDRGLRSWDLFKSIATNPQWIYFKGNHEDMLYKALKEYRELDGMMGSAQELLFYNGGELTFNEIITAENGAIPWVLNQIEKMPTHIVIENSNYVISLSHAGMTPKSKKVATEYDLIWDRNHVRDSWPRAKEFSRRIEIHGHTPIPENFITTYKFLRNPEAIYYCEGHKINIDSGAVWTNIGILFDIDTFEETIIEGVKE